MMECLAGPAWGLCYDCIFRGLGMEHGVDSASILFVLYHDPPSPCVPEKMFEPRSFDAGYGAHVIHALTSPMDWKSRQNILPIHHTRQPVSIAAYAIHMDWISCTRPRFCHNPMNAVVLHSGPRLAA